MRTRASAPSSKKTDPNHEQEQPKTPTQAERPSKTFILPSSASEDARFVTLPNPRTGTPSRYFFCPKQGVYEFTVIASQQPRSILFTASKTGNAPDDGQGDSTSAGTSGGSIAKAAELLVATPIDIVFFMIPLLSPSASTQAKKLFQPLDDIIDSQDELPKHFRHILYDDAFREVIQARVEAVCDTVEAGDEKMFRFSETKCLKELIAKADRMVAQGLPASLEERFIRQALVTPMMAVKRENPTMENNAASTNGGESQPENQETQSSTTTTTTIPGTSNSDSATPSGESGDSTPATEATPDETISSQDNVTRLLRISTALSFMKESYISTPLCARFDELLASPAESPVDFKPLQDRLQHIANLRAEALASRSLGDFSRKRGAEDEDAAEARAEKKRKEDEETKKKKAGQSRGVKDLQKVNTGGMKKMSDFFGKAAAAKKS